MSDIHHRRQQGDTVYSHDGDLGFSLIDIKTKFKPMDRPHQFYLFNLKDNE